MKKYLIWLFCLMPMFMFASAPVTDDEIFTLFKAIGSLLLFLLIPGFIIGCVCAGIRCLRGFFNI